MELLKRVKYFSRNYILILSSRWVQPRILIVFFKYKSHWQYRFLNPFRKSFYINLFWKIIYNILIRFSDLKISKSFFEELYNENNNISWIILIQFNRVKILKFFSPSTSLNDNIVSWIIDLQKLHIKRKLDLQSLNCINSSRTFKKKKHRDERRARGWHARNLYKSGIVVATLSIFFRKSSLLMARRRLIRQVNNEILPLFLDKIPEQEFLSSLPRGEEK